MSDLELNRIVPANVLLDAIHDSPGRDGTGSSEVTRREEGQLTDILLNQSNNHYELVWVHGPAGVGKTCIVQSLARKFIRKSSADTSGSDTNQSSSSIKFPGSNFFFVRRNSVTDPRKFFVTLAYRLAQSCPELAPYVQFAFDSTPQVLDLSLLEQCTVFIAQPVRAWASTSAGDQNIIMLVDGLEQCDGGESTQLELINIIHQTFSKFSPGYVRWKWFISSRSEAWIHSTFLRLSYQLSQVRFVRISFSSQAETELYIRNVIGASRTSPISPAFSSTLPTPRTSSRAIENLLWQSDGYLAYLASLFTYVNDPIGNPSDRLREVTSHVEYGSLRHKTRNMFSQLDAMYHDILSNVALGSRATAKRVLSAISLMQPSSFNDPIPRATIVASLLELTMEELDGALHHLNSVVTSPVRLPTGNFSDPELVFHHKSFDAFLRNPTRSNDWSIDLAAAHADLAKCCLRAIANDESWDYVARRWFIHCWRADTGGDNGLDAAFGILPELYEMDFRKLDRPIPLDRYFVEWLLRIQEITMSEYLLLNPGPDYSPKAQTLWSYSPYSRHDLSHSPPSTSSAVAGTSRRLPSRPTYILGIEPSNQVLLVPIFEEKDYRRKDININVIGPKEKCWDLIRGFRVTPLDELRETTAAENYETSPYVNSEFDRMSQTRGFVSASDYDELVARSLAWEEENGGSDYEQLAERSRAWDEENSRSDYEQFVARSRAWEEGNGESTEAESERTIASSLVDRQAADEESEFLGLLEALNASRITDSSQHEQSSNPETNPTEQKSFFSGDDNDGLYEDDVATVRNDEERSVSSSEILGQPSRTRQSATTFTNDNVRDIGYKTQTRTSSPAFEDSDGGDWIDSDIGIIVLDGDDDGQAEELQDNDKLDGEESFEFIERDEALH